MTDTSTPKPDIRQWVVDQTALPDELNPPDVDPMGLLDRGHAPVDLGWAGDYVKVMYATAGSSRAYHELGALAIVGSAIQHRWLPMTWATRQKLRPNIFGCYLGRSSFDHKTTALSKIHEFMPWEYLPNCYSLPGMFTEEGLYKELAEHPMGLIVRDEIGMLFASRQRKYTEFVIPFLTDAFGGFLHAKRLSSASYQSREVALSIVGATTYSEFARTTMDRDWESGWLVRWLFALPDADYDPTKETRWFSDSDNAALDNVRRNLQDLNRRNPTPMLFEQAALQFLTEWRKTLIRAAIDSSDRHERVDAIIERYATYAYKFSMILCAARGDGEQVTLGQAQDAARLAENYMTNLFRLYQYQKEHRLTGSQLQQALSILTREGQGMTKRELGQMMNVTATMRDEIIAHLLSLGAVEEIAIGKTTRLRALVPKLPTARINLNGNGA